MLTSASSTKVPPSPTLSSDDLELQKHFPLKITHLDFKTGAKLAPLRADSPSLSTAETTIGSGTLLAKFIESFQEIQKYQ